MDDTASKLHLGLEHLAQAGNDVDKLGAALIRIHGALEDHFRTWLASNSSVPLAQRALVQDRRQVQWRELLNLMQRYGDLSDETRRKILRANALRQEVAHGGAYSGTRDELEAYAALVRSLCADSRMGQERTRGAGAPDQAQPDAQAEPPGEHMPAGQAAAHTSRSMQFATLVAVMGALILVLLLSMSWRGAIQLAHSAASRGLAVVADDAATPTLGIPMAMMPATATLVGPADGLLQLRSGPARDAEALPVYLAEGMRVAIIGDAVNGMWYIEVAGQQGWIDVAYLRLDMP